MSADVPAFATCPRGLEALLHDELAARELNDVRETIGGVHFRASMRAVYEVCVWSRLANRVLKNAGYLPEEVRLRTDIEALERMVYEDIDDESRAAAARRLAVLRLRLNAGRGTDRPLHLDDAYRDRLIDKLKPGEG